MYVHYRYIHQWLCLHFQHPILQLAVYLDSDWLLAMTALRLYDERQRLTPQLPLHEGHSYRIDSSSRVDLLT